ncbi:hypothetical protein B296_00036897 [Ensete ventricosum]|uniref:ATPase AAA-type core domain-containing protein n=1 Tax=Ensete ventricosum TaxID=4639 RepID=A0A426YU33_ENSVE|nr:hypothetical protein B296_00036897 [Ensete ventricosum]
MASHYLISPAASRFSSPSPLFLPSSRSLRTNLWCQRFKNRLSVSVPLENARFGVRSLESTASPGGAGEAAAKEAAVTQEDLESQRLFEKLKDLEQQRIDKLEKFENKANLQLERQLVMASCWSRALLTLQGKLKGTEWDPENSHRIDFSEFWSLLNSNNVQFMEYSNFGQSISGVTFDDFAGQDYIKLELQEIVRILKNDKEFQDKGIYCPKGVLLHGPPGTGKTLLAKAIAGEAGLPFFAANGTDFVEVKFRFFTL